MQKHNKKAGNEKPLTSEEMKLLYQSIASFLDDKLKAL